MDPSILHALIPIAGLLAVGFAIYLSRDVLTRDTGTKEMMEVSATINEGAVAFIKRQYTTIGLLAIAGSVVIFAIISALGSPSTADTQHVGLDIGLRTGAAFLVGAAPVRRPMSRPTCGVSAVLVVSSAEMIAKITTEPAMASRPMVVYWRLMKATAPSFIVAETSIISLVPVSRVRTSRER